MRGKWQALILLFLIVNVGVPMAHAQVVKITPIGQRTGEFCGLDRALVFEDPTGVRILYDPGNTLTSANDPRLGTVHAILVTHAHGDHLGQTYMIQSPDAPNSICAPGAPSVVSANSSVAEVAAAKNSAVMANAGLVTFIGAKIAGALGITAAAGCPGAGLGNELVVPRSSPCTAVLNSGAKRTVRRDSASDGVQIFGVSAQHPSDPPLTLLSDQLRTLVAANGVSLNVGLAQGFVVAFTNGLTVYLSGDTGLTLEMSSTLTDHFGVNLAVINISDGFVFGPDEAAFAMSLIRPNAVIPSHANEAGTSGGVPIPGSRTARFVDRMAEGVPQFNDERDRFVPPKKISAYVPLSGVTMQLEGDGTCVAGCR